MTQLETTAESIQDSWRWKLWPTFLQVATVAAVDVAHKDVAELHARADRSTERLHATAEQGDQELALLATECPALLELSAVDVEQALASITEARDEVATAVRDLNLSKRKSSDKGNTARDRSAELDQPG